MSVSLIDSRPRVFLLTAQPFKDSRALSEKPVLMPHLRLSQ